MLIRLGFILGALYFLSGCTDAGFSSETGFASKLDGILIADQSEEDALIVETLIDQNGGLNGQDFDGGSGLLDGGNGLGGNTGGNGENGGSALPPGSNTGGNGENGGSVGNNGGTPGGNLTGNNGNGGNGGNGNGGSGTPNDSIIVGIDLIGDMIDPEVYERIEDHKFANLNSCPDQFPEIYDIENMLGLIQEICVIKDEDGETGRLSIDGDANTATVSDRLTICMSKDACKKIVGEEFKVKKSSFRGYCDPANSQVIILTDEQVKSLIDGKKDKTRTMTRRV